MKNSLSTPSMISTPDTRKEINFTKAGKPKLNASNQPPMKHPRKKKAK